jgi:hypothetical protein
MSRQFSLVVIVITVGLSGSPLEAGPNRDVSVAGTESEWENRSLFPDVHGDASFDQNGGGSLTNHGSVKAAKDSYTTYIADIAIWYLPAGGPWIRHYGLYGFDTWDRELTITGCEASHFVYSAKVGSTVKAEAKLNALIEGGDIYARATGMLRLTVDGSAVVSDKECLAGTRDLDKADKPEIVDGTYEYPAGSGEQNGKAAHYEAGSDVTAVAEQTLSIDVPATTKTGSTLRLNIRSWAAVRVRVPTENGWGQATVKHRYYTIDMTGNDDWEVVVQVWDDDDPAVRFHTYSWTAWGDSP